MYLIVKIKEPHVHYRVRELQPNLLGQTKRSAVTVVRESSSKLMFGSALLKDFNKPKDFFALWTQRFVSIADKFQEKQRFDWIVYFKKL